MFSKKSLIKIFSLGLIIFQCKASVVINKPTLSSDNFLQVEENKKDWDMLKNFPNAAAPVLANSFSTSNNSAKATAKDNSYAQVVNAAKSAQIAEANGKDNSIAAAVSSGNTNLNTEAIAHDNSTAVGVGVASTGGKSVANAEQGAVAVAANKNENCSDNKVEAVNKSLAAGVTTSASGAIAGANACQGSLADSKALDTVNTVSNVSAHDKSTAAGNTCNESLTKSLANADNCSKAQSVGESTSNANTDLKAIEASVAKGNTEVKSGASSNASAENGGNAIATSETKNTGGVCGVAEKGSTVDLINKSENNSNSTSDSKGTLPLQTPAQEEKPTLENPTPIIHTPNPGVRENEICNKEGQEDMTLKSEAGDIKECEETRKPEKLTLTKMEGECESEKEIECENKDETEIKCDDFNKKPEKSDCEMTCGDIEFKAKANRLLGSRKSRSADRKNERRKARRDNRKNRKLTRRERRQICEEEEQKEDNLCNEEIINKPRLTENIPINVEYGPTPNVNLEACANKFINTNANNIKAQSAEHLKNVQNLLKNVGS